ncbi:MAG: DUF4139 domain-containing protein [Gemmataceae bacterium]
MRKWLYAGLGLAGLGLAGLLFAPNWLRARPAGKSDTPDEAPTRPTTLPLGQVVLFSSGVGYYQREGSVEGDARVDLSFPASDVNDLLKSMVLRDLDGGQVATVSYDSNAPLERTLKSFAVNLTGTPSFGDILHQARGERVEVALANVGAGTLSGSIIGVEKQRQLVNKEPVETPVLNLWCVDGMRAVRLADVQRVRFLNPALDGEFRKALEALAQSHDAQKRAVSVRFTGEGKRRVRVGYVVESPIWKTSYRLVLNGKAGEKPYLQGWAVVENPSDEDWRDVRMALVSGRPISFQMDLYQPLYVNRPTVALDLFQGLNPVAYEGRIERDFLKREVDRAQEQAANRFEEAQDARKLSRRQSGAAMDGAATKAYNVPLAKKALAEQLSLGDSVASSATAMKLGDNFQYSIDRPVSLARQKSALLPIVTKDVEASRVSIYNERVQARFPLLGLRFKNVTGVGLMQGPITVFENSNYAGDAQIKDIQPNEERLLSYAIDLATEVVPAPAQSNGRITQVKAIKGVVSTTTRIVESRIYTAKNRGSEEKTLLIEHPIRHDFKLVDSKPTETTADLYRFEVKLPAGQTKPLTVQEERTLATTISLATQSDDQIRYLLTLPTASEGVKAGLRKAMELRSELEKTTRESAEQRKQLSIIEKDQERLRANLREMPTTAAAYKRYLEKFDKQETEIERYQADIKKLDGVSHQQKKTFDDFVTNFSAE